MILLTGVPGVGKTTLCAKVLAQLRILGADVKGFLTEEIRSRGVRTGFQIVSLDGEQRESLAVTEPEQQGPRVGKYTVTLPNFEQLALPALDDILDPKTKCVCILDEIGKMELFSKDFVSKMRAILRSQNQTGLCTIALKGGGFIAEAKAMEGVELLEVTHANRDHLLEIIMAKLTAHRSSMNSVPSAATAHTLRGEACAASKPNSRRAPLEHMHSSRPQADAAASAEAPARAILWFRNDLRLHDNPTFDNENVAHLMRSHRSNTVIPVYCLDPRDYGRTASGSPKMAPARARFIQESLIDLTRSLRGLGSDLLVLPGKPEKVLPRLCAPNSIIVAQGELCREERQVEAAVAAAASQHSAVLQLHWGGTLCPAPRPEALAEAIPDDFKAFQRWIATISDGADVSASAVPAVLPPLRHEELVLPCVPLRPEDLSRSIQAVKDDERGGWILSGGESQGLRRMESWIATGGLNGYKKTFRNLNMVEDSSSKLGAHLAHGCISVRTLAARVRRHIAQHTHSAAAARHFLYELTWRDYFRFQALKHGNKIFTVDGPLGHRRRWRHDKDQEAAFCSGVTGVPLVDACMRELQATGYLGNLGRQIVAAYLVDDLQLDWRIGARWFEACLVDYDVHTNWGQWLRSAGAMSTNQGKQQRMEGMRYLDIAIRLPGDEAARYVRTWVHELQKVPRDQLFSPWTLSKDEAASYGLSQTSYPSPIGQKTVRYFGASPSKEANSVK
ncbi:hypothetical protein CYMTET_54788 [Cymbomonas tetramitiformis]|uniref:Cryptochrome DASH n=1 Tax=Cymbomonas tetramitiformis TaxID=36881 RepID=A0AAE0BG19_9CHLO|nr:hypothetical protein CYMTET_54788 [Cymbomonas tetramitiformis]